MIIYIAGILFTLQIGKPDAPYPWYDKNTEWELNNYIYFGDPQHALLQALREGVPRGARDPGGERERSRRSEQEGTASRCFAAFDDDTAYAG